MALSATFHPASKKENLVKFGLPTTTVSARMLTRPKSIMRILCMLTYLSSGHVTLQRGEFLPSKLLHASDLRCRTASRWALPHISSLGLLYCQAIKSNHLYDAILFLSMVRPIGQTSIN